MDGEKKLRKGEQLFKENEPVDTVFVIKTGKVSLYVERSGKKVEIESLGPSQVCGEQAVFGQPRMPFSAEAATEVRLMEVPVALMKSQYEAASPAIKLLFKSLTEGLRQTRKTIQTFRMEQDSSPCPQMLIPKIFSILVLVADHSGKKLESGDIQLSWGTLKIYTTRMFLDSLARMEGLLQLLSKLGYVELKYEKNDDGDEELIDFVVKNLRMIEDFSEFYQYNLFKGGKAEIIYVDPLAVQVAKAILYAAREAEVDRRGAVTLNYDTMLKEIKTVFKLELKPTHLNALEKKGLFVKRQTRDDGVFMSFDKAEWERVYAFWRIIAEIDKWNEKGFVDLREKEEEISESGPPQCPSCGTETAVGQNFCPNCGFKLAA